MAKIIFVGIHNKPGKQPLDSSTKTGKTIDEIRLIIGAESVKSNLYDQETWPDINRRNIGQQMVHVAAWQIRVKYEPGDLIVCLGEIVGGIFNYWKKIECSKGENPSIVVVPHPAARPHDPKYISNTVLTINTYGQ